MDEVINDIKQADRKIKKAHRYNCGLMNDLPAESLKASDAHFFFESPDGQNGELHSELVSLGFKDAGYNAPYFWHLVKDEVKVSYVEGDLYIKVIK